MMPYILHVSVIVTVCFLFYKLFLQKETFYQLNRWTLLACLTVSFILPLLPAPHGFNWRERLEWSPALAVDKIASEPGETGSGRSETSSGMGKIGSGRSETGSVMDEAESSVSKKASGVHAIAAEKDETPPTVAAPTTNATATSARTPIAPSSPSTPSSPSPGPLSILLMIVHALFCCYLIGVCLFGAHFILQIAVLCHQSYTQPVIRDGRYRIVETSGNRAPCSFGNNIFINPGLYDPETYQQILIHEKIHVSGRHTLDILVAEIAVVLQWFNPFIWLYRREVENNLEFLTDQSVLLHRGVERFAYQLSLLRVSAPHLPFSITNNYNQSLLKRRIVMMNSQRSSRSTVWKYFFLLPLLTVLVFTLNKPAAFGQSATATVAGSAHNELLDTGQLQQVQQPQQPQQQPGTAVSGSSGYSGSSGSAGWRDTTVRPATRSTNAEPVTPVPVTEAISAQSAQPESWPASTAQPVISLQSEVSLQPAISLQPQLQEAMSIDPAPVVHVDLDMHITGDSAYREGSWFVTSRGDELEFELRAGNDEHNWESSFTVKKNEIDPFPGQGTVTFKLVREAGTMNFKGQFDGQQGFGHFEFQPDPAYFQVLKQMGVEDLDENNEESFFFRNVKKDYVAMLQRNGYMPMSRHNVTGFAAMNIDEDFLKSMKGAGIEGLDDAHSFVTLKARHIDKAYIDDLRAAGYDHLTVHDLVSLNAQHIDGQYVRSMGAGKSDSFIPPHELISYKASGIDSGYLASLRKLGYAPLNRHEIFAFHSMHIDPDFIKGFQDAGLTNLPMRTLLSFKANGITPEYAKAFHDLGYTDIETNRLVSLKSMGITPDFVQEFHKIGYDHIPFNLLASLKSMGIDAAYVARMKGKGFDSQDLRKYMRLKQDFN
jgi:BlaR1 peptidase M56